jgi:hypothetical protein
MVRNLGTELGKVLCQICLIHPFSQFGAADDGEEMWIATPHWSTSSLSIRSRRDVCDIADHGTVASPCAQFLSLTLLPNHLLPSRN